MRGKKLIELTRGVLTTLFGGFLVVHWWWTALHPYLESYIPQFFVSHLLLFLGFWLILKETRRDGKLAFLFSAFFLIYGLVMAVLLIPGGIEEVGVFAVVIPIYLMLLGGVLGGASFIWGGDK